MKKKRSACTSILIGRRATIDGTIIIGRNEDAKAAWPKRMEIHPHGSLPQKFVSRETGVEIPLPADSARYSATPEWDDSAGLFEEDGINEYEVAMSATESAYTNELILGFDPLVKKGLNEEAMLTVVLPFIKTAREGVARLGNLIAHYGTGETNGVLFADNREAWYFESAGGHYWVAQRIPDDGYAVVGNQLAIQAVNFNDLNNFMFHPTIRQFVAENRLNPHPDSFNFREIFGTHDRKDAIYSTPRVWYGHQMFSPIAARHEVPEDQDLPFIMKPERKLSILDAQNYLSSHYQGTPFDPLGTGCQEQKHRYRPVSLAKTQEAHLLQLNRSTGANIHWLAMGVGAESVYVPFFNGITDVPAAYKQGKLPAETDAAYWVYKQVGVLVDSHLHDFWPLLKELQKDLNVQAIKMIHTTDRHLAELTDRCEREAYLTKQSEQFAKAALGAFQKFAMELITKMTDYSPLNFETDDNL